nr:hypothetical protein [Treponema phagedenis]
MDPPRKGADEVVLDTIMRVAPKRVVYVSCNPATLARDLKILSTNYDVKRVIPVDMFPHTMSVETVALLCRKDIDSHIEVKLELDEEDVTKAENKATYAEIKEYVWDKFELKVPTLYIAQIKRKCGIELREHCNKSKKISKLFLGVHLRKKKP